MTGGECNDMQQAAAYGDILEEVDELVQIREIVVEAHGRSERFAAQHHQPRRADGLRTISESGLKTINWSAVNRSSCPTTSMIPPITKTARSICCPPMRKRARPGIDTGAGAEGHGPETVQKDEGADGSPQS